MAPDRSWRARLRTTVLEASTPSGRAYNVVVFGAILVSVLALMLEPDPFGNSALRQTDVVWIDLVQNICLGIFAADFVLHLFVSERPLKYLFSFYGLIDFTAVLFLHSTGAQRNPAVGVQIRQDSPCIQVAALHR